MEWSDRVRTNAVAPESNHPAAVVITAKVLRLFAGRYPLVQGVRLATSDPRIQADYDNDPRTYHGGLRISTGLALLEGLIEIAKRAPVFDTPIRIMHGDKDRVTSHHESIAFIAQAVSTDKSIRIMPGLEHVMFGIGETEEEDRPRQEVCRYDRLQLRHPLTVLALVRYLEIGMHGC